MTEIDETVKDIKFAAERAPYTTGNELLCYEHFIEYNRERLLKLRGIKGADEHSETDAKGKDGGSGTF